MIQPGSSNSLEGRSLAAGKFRCRMSRRLLCFAWITVLLAAHAAPVLGDKPEVDAELERLLARYGFTGRIERQLEVRLGRRIDAGLADIGRNLFFDPIMALRRDNSCAGCH